MAIVVLKRGLFSTSARKTAIECCITIHDALALLSDNLLLQSERWFTTSKGPGFNTLASSYHLPRDSARR